MPEKKPGLQRDPVESLIFSGVFLLKNYIIFELHSYEMQTLDSFHFIDANLSLFLGFSDC